MQSPNITLTASNELPVKLNKMTVVGVDGDGFTPGGSVSISIHLGGNHGRVVAHGFTRANLDGNIGWGRAVQPRLACDADLSAQAHDLDSGASAGDVTTVDCP